MPRVLVLAAFCYAAAAVHSCATGWQSLTAAAAFAPSTAARWASSTSWARNSLTSAQCNSNGWAQTDRWLCVVSGAARPAHTVHDIVELHSEPFGIISPAYGLVLLSRMTAVEPTVALYVMRTCRYVVETLRVGCRGPYLLHLKAEGRHCVPSSERYAKC